MDNQNYCLLVWNVSIYPCGNFNGGWDMDEQLHYRFSCGCDYLSVP